MSLECGSLLPPGVGGGAQSKSPPPLPPAGAAPALPSDSVSASAHRRRRCCCCSPTSRRWVFGCARHGAGGPRWPPARAAGADRLRMVRRAGCSGPRRPCGCARSRVRHYAALPHRLRDGDPPHRQRADGAAMRAAVRRRASSTRGWAGRRCCSPPPMSHGLADDAMTAAPASFRVRSGVPRLSYVARERANAERRRRRRPAHRAAFSASVASPRTPCTGRCTSSS